MQNIHFEKEGEKLKLIEDKGQKMEKHTIKNAYWKSQNIEVERFPLPVGDYIVINDKVQELLDRKAKRGTEIKKMDFLGTYNICVDSKRDIQELISNICGAQHERFRDECYLALNNGIKLIILVEDDGGYCDKKQTIYNKPISCIQDIFSWKNPRAFIFSGRRQKYPNATKGAALAKALLTMEKKYGCEFVFCERDRSGAEIIKLLTEKEGYG